MIFNLFKKKKISSGALIDVRSVEKKIKDFTFEEIVTSVNPVNWIEKPQSQWRKFPIFNQDGSGSCVAQTMAKLLGILYWLKNGIYVHFSATHIYQRRSNKPSGGMAGVDAFDIARQGATLEVLTPSQDMNDAQMDSTSIEQYKKDVGNIFKISNYVVLPIKDIDTVASVIQTTNKAVMVWFYFNHDEWLDVPEVKRQLDVYASATSRHSVTAVDFTLYNGKRSLIIEDSWGPGAGKGGQRVITEDFFKERNFFAAYPITFQFDEPSIPFQLFKFNKDMRQGDRNNDVKELQKVLQKLGFFPSNIDATGYFGSITKASVIKFQTSKGLVPDGVVGKTTRYKLNMVDL